MALAPNAKSNKKGEEMSPEVRAYQRRAIGVAYDLGYPKSTIEKLKAATTELQIINILAAARHGKG